MKLEKLNILNIEKNGFVIGLIQVNRFLPNVKPEFKGVRQSITRGLLGFFIIEEEVVIHFIFFMFFIEK